MHYLDQLYKLLIESNFWDKNILRAKLADSTEIIFEGNYTFGARNSTTGREMRHTGNLGLTAFRDYLTRHDTIKIKPI